MPRPQLADRLEFKTMPQIAEALGMETEKVGRWIKAGLLPPPTVIKENGLRLFDQWWIAAARRALTERQQ